MSPKKSPLKVCILKTLEILKKEKIDYFLLGGVALTLLGQPRFTRDLDIDVFLTKDEAFTFIKKAKKASFKIAKKEMEERIKTFGNFRMFYKDVPVDMILASTDLEKSALARKTTVDIYGKKANVPSPEDFILLKIIPGRPQDLIDVESVALKYKGTLDIKYLEEWAKKIADEMENFRVWHQLKNLLKI